MTLPDTTPDGRPIVKNFGARAFQAGATRSHEEQRSDWAREHRISMSGARLVGDLTFLDLGFTIWSTTQRLLPEDVPLGGTIVERREQRDSDTGEILERAFLCVDQYRCRPRIRPALLQVGEIDRASMESPEDSRLRYLVRRFAEEIAASKGPLTPRLIEIDRWQHDLVAVLAGARR